MNLKKLSEAIDEYRNYLHSPARWDELYKWESLKIWQQNWDLEALDFGGMYDKALENTTTRRLWVGPNFYPKKMMAQFISLQKEYVREAFRDLFNENRDLSGRIGRFHFHCDELLAAFCEANPKTLENSHFHEDERMCSIYLGFRYPEQYTLFDFPSFQRLMRRVGSADIPSIADYDRYSKTIRTIFRFLEKSEGLMETHFARLNPDLHYTDRTLLLAHEFCIVTGY